MIVGIILRNRVGEGVVDLGIIGGLEECGEVEGYVGWVSNGNVVREVLV